METSTSTGPLYSLIPLSFGRARITKNTSWDELGIPFDYDHFW